MSGPSGDLNRLQGVDWRAGFDVATDQAYNAQHIGCGVEQSGSSSGS